MSLKFLITLLASAAILSLNTACAEPEGGAREAGTVEHDEAAPAKDGPAEAAPAEAAPVVASSPSREAAPRRSDGMRIPVDGTSLEAFNESLAQIKEQASESEYTTLTNAIDYLMVYDLAAKRDRAKLAANLDGMTGEEIIDKVQRRKGR